MCARCIADNVSPMDRHPSARRNAQLASDEMVNATIRLIKMYLESNLGCSHKEVRLVLGLSQATVRKAIVAIRAEQKAQQRMKVDPTSLPTNFAEYLRKKRA